MRSNLFHKIAAVGATLALGAAACGGESSAGGEKSGGASAPVTLRLGTVEGDGAPYADEVKRFAEDVRTLSEGSIDVEIAWEASGPFSAESERILAGMAQDGEIDLALVATRASGSARCDLHAGAASTVPGRQRRLGQRHRRR